MNCHPLDCRCMRIVLARDEFETVRDKCPIHGPEGTPERMKGWLAREHLRRKLDRLAAEAEMYRVVRAATNDPWLDKRIQDAVARGVMAGLRHYETALHRNMTPDPMDTPERRRLIREFGFDPEEENEA